MEFEGIPLEVIHRRVKYPRVEFKAIPGRLRVIVPPGINPLRVLEDNKTSILKKYRRLMRQIETARKIPMTDWTEKEFTDIISRYVERYSRQLKVKISQIKLRKMKRRWGSCRNDGIITLNIFLQFVPEHLIAYIIYHELAHLIVKGHNRKFKTIIAREFPNYRQLDKELNLYGLKLLS
jgi:predicted metal-dependent hydrolase